VELRTNKIVFILLMNSTKHSYFVWASELLACFFICISKFSWWSSSKCYETMNQIDIIVNIRPPIR
jgi:hypothetical protein